MNRRLVSRPLLALIVLLSGVNSFAQSPQIQMAAPEFAVYSNAVSQTAPAAKASALEGYLAAYPQSAVKLDVLVMLMITYGQINDSARALATADRIMPLDPNNLRALIYEATLRRSAADAITDQSARQFALDTAADFARRGLAASSPQGASEADFQAVRAFGAPIFYGVVGIDALSKKDDATAIFAFQNELNSSPPASTQTPGLTLQDTFFLAEAFDQSNPPDLLKCAFYAARSAAFAPEPFKSQMLPTAKYCYKKYHGGDDGYDSLVATATANLNPPPGLYIKPAPTPADIIAQVIASTPDLSTLAIGDREFILQYGRPEDVARIWTTMYGKSLQFPATVIQSSRTEVKAAVSDDAVQSLTADFAFQLKPGSAPVDLPAGAKMTLQGTFDSFTSQPFMIVMKDAAVLLPVPHATPTPRPVRRPMPPFEPPPPVTTVFR